MSEVYHVVVRVAHREPFGDAVVDLASYTDPAIAKAVAQSWSLLPSVLDGRERVQVVQR